MKLSSRQQYIMDVLNRKGTIELISYCGLGDAYRMHGNPSYEHHIEEMVQYPTINALLRAGLIEYIPTPNGIYAGYYKAVAV